jgi:hypothetical protein
MDAHGLLTSIFALLGDLRLVNEHQIAVTPVSNSFPVAPATVALRIALRTLESQSCN